MFMKWKEVAIEVLKDVKYETDLLIGEYLRHLDGRFSTMIEMVSKIEGRKELISYIRKALLDVDEQEFSESLEKVKKGEVKDERKNDLIILNKPDLIIVTVTGGCLIFIVWGISFIGLYWYMKQRRSVKFVPRSVRFTKLPDSPVSRPRTMKNPAPILKKEEPVYIELNNLETLV